MSVLYPCQAARVRAWGAQLPEVLTNSFRTETSALFQLWGRRIKWVGSFRFPAESSTGTFAGLLQHFVSRAAGVAGEHEHISKADAESGCMETPSQHNALASVQSKPFRCLRD